MTMPSHVPPWSWPWHTDCTSWLDLRPAFSLWAYLKTWTLNWTRSLSVGLLWSPCSGAVGLSPWSDTPAPARPAVTRLPACCPLLLAGNSHQESDFYDNTAKDSPDLQFMLVKSQELGLHLQKGIHFHLTACLSWAGQHCKIMNETVTEISGSIIQVNYRWGSRQGLERIQESTRQRFACAVIHHPVQTAKHCKSSSTCHLTTSESLSYSDI